MEEIKERWQFNERVDGRDQIDKRQYKVWEAGMLHSKYVGTKIKCSESEGNNREKWCKS